MHAIKRALLAGTILPMLAVMPGFTQGLRIEGAIILAQAQDQDPRQRRPGQPQQGRPNMQPPRQPAAPIQQPLRQPAQSAPLRQAPAIQQQPRQPAQFAPQRQAPPIQQRSPVQASPPQQPRAPVQAIPPQQPRVAAPAAVQQRPPVGIPPTTRSGQTQQPTVRGTSPAVGGRPTVPPPGFIPPQDGRGAVPPAATGQRNVPLLVPPPAAGVSSRPAGSPGAIRPADGRPPFSGNPQGQTVPPPVSGQRAPGAPGTLPGVARPPGTPPAIGQRAPGTPPTGQPSAGQPPVVGQPGIRQPLVPGQPGTGQPQVPGQPGLAQPGPGLPPTPGQPGFGQRGPGLPGQVPGAAGPGGLAGGQPPPSGPPDRRQGSRIGPAGAAAIGLGVGLIGGFMLNQGARADDVSEVRSRRREFTEDGVTVIHEPGRTIVRDGVGIFIRHDETARFRDLGGDFRTERRGDEMISIYERPGGMRVITVTDENGQLLRRIRRYPDGREVILIDNSFRPRARTFEEQIIVLPPPEYSMPRERYLVDAGGAPPEMIYEALTAPPVQRLPRRYTLDEVRHSPTVRAYTRSVDVNTINFDAGSWQVKPDQIARLDTIAAALGRAITANPNEVFLIEGHTDAVGNDTDNLSLSDRRAQSIAAVLTQSYNIPPENLTTQGYGEQFPRVQTQGPSRENRRVTLRRVTDLLNQQNSQTPPQ